MSWGNDADPDNESEDASTGGGREDQSGRDAPGDAGDSSGLREDDAVRMFDAEEFNLTWSGVRPGLEYRAYISGNLVAEQVARRVRESLYPYLKNGNGLDVVEARTDYDGNPYLWLRLGAAGAAELLDLARVGLRMRGDVGGGLG